MRSWYRPKATARINGGGARRQALQKQTLAVVDAGAAKSSVSPHRAQARPVWSGNSLQQTAQIGAVESCGKGEPHRLQDAGRRAQLIASMGLRSTRATARQREVCDGGTSNVSEPESLRKTHLTSRWRRAVLGLRTRRLADSIPGQEKRCHGNSRMQGSRINCPYSPVKPGISVEMG
jgi:hypothetical protein